MNTLGLETPRDINDVSQAVAYDFGIDDTVEKYLTITPEKVVNVAKELRTTAGNIMAWETLGGDVQDYWCGRAIDFLKELGFQEKPPKVEIDCRAGVPSNVHEIVVIPKMGVSKFTIRHANYDDAAANPNVDWSSNGSIAQAKARYLGVYLVALARKGEVVGQPEILAAKLIKDLEQFDEKARA